MLDEHWWGILQISDKVYPLCKAFIEPDLKVAQLRIYNTFNPFPGFTNATYILKSSKQVSASAICELLPVTLGATVLDCAMP